MLESMSENLDIFACPSCRGNLSISRDSVMCAGCGKNYGVDSGIPILLCNEKRRQDNGVAEKIKAFYEQTPFPNYEKCESAADLVQKAQKGVFARLLNEQVPFNVRVLEAGCGTGQLSNFLGIAQRYVFGTDLCLNSLKLAQAFKTNNGLNRVSFYQMDLFNPAFKDESFPLVICNGVLHHTADPFGGFLSISRLVKKRGYIIIGLYNKYGRTMTNVRRAIFNLYGDRLKFLDPRMRKLSIGEVKKHAWFRDQYKNPHESQHSISEALRWLDKAGFDFVSGIPKLKAFEAFKENEQLFKENPRGSAMDHFIIQLKMVFTCYEGGFFMVIGRKRG